jgi:hypothetical protein
MASGSFLTMVLVAALSSSLTLHFVGYQNDNSSQLDGRNLRGMERSYGGSYYDNYYFNRGGKSGKWGKSGKGSYGYNYYGSYGSSGKYKPSKSEPYSLLGKKKKPSSRRRRVGDAFADGTCRKSAFSWIRTLTAKTRISTLSLSPTRVVPGLLHIIFRKMCKLQCLLEPKCMEVAGGQ